jgi:hypothetical protein
MVWFFRIIADDPFLRCRPPSLTCPNPPSSPLILSPSQLPKMPSAKEIVEEKVASHGVVVYSKSTCPYCTATKKLLRDLGANFELVELNQVSGGDDLQDAIEGITGAFTLMMRYPCDGLVG